ncbi:MAG: hypothetical protein IPO88_21465 [Nannocystis sp.]|nr:fibrinogen-like YCDxxxxGGGW domain-containing protein [Nannocystis sp.]MBK9756023.1 hypothetical protein [Nannocystis sp.]
MAIDGTYTIDPDGAGPGAAITAYCDMKTDGGGWTMVFKLSSGVAGDANNLWNGAALNESDPALLDLKKSTKHYVSGYIANYWNKGGVVITDVRTHVYKNAAIQKFWKYDGATTTSINWFTNTRLTASSYPDLPGGPSTTTRSPATARTAVAGSSIASMAAATSTRAGSSSTAPPILARGRPTSTPPRCASFTPPASASPTGRRPSTTTRSASRRSSRSSSVDRPSELVAGLRRCNAPAFMSFVTTLLLALVVAGSPGKPRKVRNMPDGWTWPPSAAMKEAGARCLAALDAAEVQHRPAAPVKKIATPIEIPEMRIGGITLVPLRGEGPFPMDCHFAAAIAGVAPELRALGVRSLHFRTLHKYRAVRKRGKSMRFLSRHAVGLAIDVFEVGFDDREILRVKAHWSAADHRLAKVAAVFRTRRRISYR